MNNNKIFETTRRAVEAPLEFTNTVMEQSKKLRSPSLKVAKIGSMAGSSIGVGLLAIGTFQLLTGRHSWAVSTLSAGVLTIGSNIIYYKNHIMQKTKR